MWRTDLKQLNYQERAFDNKDYADEYAIRLMVKQEAGKRIYLLFI